MADFHPMRNERLRSRWGTIIEFVCGVAWTISNILFACGKVRGEGSGVPVAESAVAPPGPIPNPVVTRRSAGEYLGGDPQGGEAAAGTPDP
jgi:hypothetical protein